MICYFCKRNESIIKKGKEKNVAWFCVLRSGRGIYFVADKRRTMFNPDGTVSFRDDQAKIHRLKATDNVDCVIVNTGWLGRHEYPSGKIIMGIDSLFDGLDGFPSEAVQAEFESRVFQTISRGDYLDYLFYCDGSVHVSRHLAERGNNCWNGVCLHDYNFEKQYPKTSMLAGRNFEASFSGKYEAGHLLNDPLPLAERIDLSQDIEMQLRDEMRRISSILEKRSKTGGGPNVVSPECDVLFLPFQY